MSSTLVINELLCFLQCKIDVIDEISLVQICESNFKDSEIIEANSILSEAVNSRSKRKGEGKSKRILQDLIKLLKETEPNLIPTFVAKDLHRLPPVTFDYIDVTSLLKTILTVKQDIHRIQSDYVKSSELIILQEQLESIKSKSNQTTYSNIARKNREKSNGTILNESCEVDALAAASAAVPSSPRALLPLRASAPTSGSPAVTLLPSAESLSKNIADIHSNQQPLNYIHRTSTPVCTLEVNTLKDTSNEDSFTTIVNKKKINKYRNIRKTNKNQQGQAVLTSNKIKIVPRHLYIYASRFVTGTTEDDIKEFINDCGHTVVKVEKLTQFKETGFSSFKITVEQNQGKAFLDANFWPRGIVYRRYTEKRVSTETISHPEDK